MQKKYAVAMARQGVKVGELREILQVAIDKANPYRGSRVNKHFSKREVWDILVDGLKNCADDDIADVNIAKNVLWEFAPDERQIKLVINEMQIPF